MRRGPYIASFAMCGRSSTDIKSVLHAKERLGIALFLVAFLSASAQPLLQADQAIVDAARGRYYSLQKKGFVSLACTVPIDTATVPLLPMLGTPSQNLLKAPSESR